MKLNPAGLLSLRPIVRASLCLFLLGLAARGAAQPSDELPFLDVWVNIEADVSFAITLNQAPPWAGNAEEVLSKAVGVPVTASAEKNEDGSWTLSAECEGLARRNRLSITGSVPVAALVQLIAGSPSSEVFLVFSCPETPRCEIVFQNAEPYSEDDWKHVRLTATPESIVEPIRFDFGFSLMRFLVLGTGTVAAMALLLAFLVWRRNPLLRSCAEDPAAAWFAYLRLSRNITYAAVLVTLIPITLADPTEPIAFLLMLQSRLFEIALGLTYYACVMMLFASLASLIAYPIQTRVKGIQATRKGLALHSALAVSLGLVPFSFFLLALTAFNHAEYATGAALAFCALGALLVLATQRWRVYGVRPERLTDCPLRERVFALAAKAGVKLNEVHILTPGIRMSLANAFAASGRKVLISDLLIERLSVREVDAVIGHELAHLRGRHPEKIRRALVFGFILFAVAAASSVWAIRRIQLQNETAQDVLSLSAGVLVVLAGVAIFNAMRRRQERAADRGAVELTGDPEACIMSQVKLHRLNALPLQWKRIHEFGLTHPSAMRRMEAMARSSGISAERLASLMESQDDDSRYTIPEAVLDEGRVFSSPVRHRIMLWNMCVQFLFFGLLPALVALAVLHLEPQGAVRWAAYIGGAFLTLAGAIGVSGYLSQMGALSFEARLAARLERKGIRPSDLNASFVSFSPDDLPRIYEGYFNTDIGFLALTGHRLCFLGDAGSFAIPRTCVASVRLGRRRPGWYNARPIVIEWRDSENAEPAKLFCVAPYDIGHSVRSAAAAKSLMQRIKAWIDGEGSAVPVSEFLAALPLPDVAAPTSSVLRLTRQMVFTTLMRQLVVALLLSMLTGLFLSIAEAGPGFYAVLTSVVAHLLYLVPFMGGRLDSV